MIKNSILSLTELFLTEKHCLLQAYAAGTLDDLTMRTSISRSIRVLGCYPIRNPTLLIGYFDRYHLYEMPGAYVITNADPVWKSISEVYAAFGQKLPENKIIDITYLTDDIFDSWFALWNQEFIYNVLSDFAFLYEPSQPIGALEGIAFLDNLEHEILRESAKH